MSSDDFTLYCGAAAGAEAAFGEAAERWNVTEVNYTFEGHRDARTRGRKVLTAKELAHGAVSLSYVGNLMRRVYKDTPVFRNTLALLWHVIDAGDEVFCVGWIKDDGTVKGGTGWGTELAKLFRKELYVFDQDQDGWFRWDHMTWVPCDAPKITSKKFAATGTRLLSDAGRAAIRSLFERSFGA
ncbi:MAG: hypothetical protein CSA66_00205 [Proteobacteria bacterium]|nr:MAG: hypothetical protein CSA66_00205 [Pseudomonadota bacterium]